MTGFRRTSAAHIFRLLAAVTCFPVLTCFPVMTRAQETVAEAASPAAHVLELLRQRNLEGALAELGRASAGRKGLPEVEPDPILPSAAGGVFRALAQEDADLRYELLSEWTLPDGDRSGIRSLTALVPQSAPPPAFARVIRERPRDSTFAVAEINGIRGLFSTGWLLATAAEESGRLRRLTSDLETLAKAGVSGAETLLLLTRLAGARPDVQAVRESLTRRAGSLRKTAGDEQANNGSIDSDALVLAAAALKHPELHAHAEQILDGLVESTLEQPFARLRPFLRIAQATAIQIHRGDSGPEVLRTNQLKYWIPVSGRTAASSALGAVDTMWLTHEDHILHVAGSGQDALLFRYPLAGEFDFQCEAQEGGRIGTDGGLTFGGLYFKAVGSVNQLTVRDADGHHSLNRPCPFVRHEDRPVFNRVSIRTRTIGPQKKRFIQFLANLHPMWSDQLTAASPWLGLSADAWNRPVFRNLKLTGTPVIPREVRLTEGQQLRGWRSAFYGETQPTFHAGGRLSLNDGRIAATTAALAASPPTSAAAPAAEQPAAADTSPATWQLHDGTLTAAREDIPNGAPVQSVLRYQRPLLDGESVSYEYFYQPGEQEVHPAIGRLALLIAASGIRIHWMTDGDHDWTGLPADNSTLEPLNRRGGRNVPVKENEWNTVTLARSDGKVHLTLNGTLVYERPIDFGGDLQFGLFRDRSQHAVRVRNVVLTGDWPETVPDECLANPATVRDRQQAVRDRQALHQLADERWLAENVIAVRAAAAREPTADDTYSRLAQWVLPQDDRASLRMTAAFTPVDPPPVHLLEQQRGISWMMRRLPHVEHVPTPPHHQTDLLANASPGAAQLVSPVYDLIDLAAQTNRLEELERTLRALPPATGSQDARARAALLAMIHMHQDRPQEAARQTAHLFSLLPAEPPETLADMWPETLLVWRALTRFGVTESVGDVLTAVFQQRTMRTQPPGIEFWQTQISGLMGWYNHIVHGGSRESFFNGLQVKNWVASTRTRARSRGVGAAEARWLQHSSSEIHHVSGHQEEYLLYGSPLRGNFEITCEIGGHGTTQPLTAGLFHGAGSNHSILETGSFRRGVISRDTIDPPFTPVDRWVRFRAVFRDGHCSVFINGRPVARRQLVEHHDPWFGIHSWYRNTAAFRDVRIGGTPFIPEEVLVSGTPDLSGWLPFYDETVGYDSADWTYLPDSDSHGIIRGRRRPGLGLTFRESLLTYLRPLTDNTEVSYEFFYEPQRFETHPAFDRVAFLLKPEGVQLHWLTDCRYDATGISPENVFDRRDTPVPLRVGDWNHLRMVRSNGLVRVEVNDRLVASWQTPEQTRGVFGLFHFADQSEVRVRRVTLKGDWPRQMPSVDQQELADSRVAELNARRQQLTGVFEHDFSDGAPPELFQYHDPKGGGQVVQLPDGLRVTRQALNTWTSSELNARFLIRGDFDVEAEFTDFQHAGENDATAMLTVRLDDALQQTVRAVRSRTRQQRQFYQISRSALRPDGTRTYPSRNVTCEATSGRLRLARRGDQVFYLFAEGDSQHFRLFGEETVTDADSIPGAVNLNAVANGTARVSVTWKKLRIAAEELLVLPDPDIQPHSEIFVMNTDGTGLRSLTGGEKTVKGAGSPDWSPDGRRIAFDVYTGARRGCYLINVDGTGLKSLGPGLMPTFGRDARQLAFTWSGRGMALMDIEGGNRRILSPEGWGAQFSPDGKSVAWQSSQRTAEGRSTNITVFDIETGRRKTILQGEHARRYSSIYWNMEWSPDSRQICFKGRLRENADRYEVAIAPVRGSATDFRILTDETTDTDFGWHPDGSRILLSKPSPQHRRRKLFVCHLADGRMTLFPNQPLDTLNTSGVWSPDGQQIAFVRRIEPKPVPYRAPDTTGEKTRTALTAPAAAVPVNRLRSPE